MKKFLLIVSLFLASLIPAAAQCTPGTWTVANQPPVGCIPYAQNGIFTKLLPNAGAGGPLTHLVPNSASIINNIYTDTDLPAGYSVVAGPGDLVGDGTGSPIWYGKQGDCVYIMPLNMPRSVVGDVNNPSGKIFHVPCGASYANINGSGDQFITVWDQVSNIVLSGYHCCSSGGINFSSTCTSTSTANPCPGPTGWSSGNQANWSNDLGYHLPFCSQCTIQSGGTGALNVPGLEGLITNKEWMDPSGQGIHHALYLNTSCEGGPNVVFPDSGFSAGTCDTTATKHALANRPFNGNMMFLDYTDAQINAMNLPAWQKPVIYALSHYGGYIGDTNNGSGNLSPSRFESPVPYVATGVTDPIPAWLCPSSCQPGVGKNQVPSGAFQYSLPFFTNIPLVGGTSFTAHMHIADSCVALGLANQPNGCASGGSTAPNPPTGLTITVHYIWNESSEDF